MTEDVYYRARMVRHTLTAWGLLLVAIIVASLPAFGFPLTLVLVGCGILATGKLVLYGFWRQSLLLLVLYCLVIVLAVFSLILGIGKLTEKLPDDGLLGEVKRMQPSVGDDPVPLPVERIKQDPKADPSIGPDEYQKEALALMAILFEAQHRDHTEIFEKSISPTITYCGKTIAASEHIENLRRDFGHWQTRREVLDGDAEIKRQTAGQIIARFSTRYEFQSAEGHTLSGTRAHVMGFTNSDNQLLLKSHDVKDSPSVVWVDRFVRPYAEEVNEFILAMLEEERIGEIESLSVRFADEVEYFGTKKSRAEVLKDKAQYWERWPIRLEQQLGSAEVISGSGDSINVLLPTYFSVENHEKNERRSGKILHQISLIRSDNSFLVISQKGDVSDLQQTQIKAFEEPDLPTR